MPLGIRIHFAFKKILWIFQKKIYSKTIDLFEYIKSKEHKSSIIKNHKKGLKKLDEFCIILEYFDLVILLKKARVSKSNRTIFYLALAKINYKS